MLTENEAASLLHVAHKYDVTGLIRHCSDVMASCIRVDNVCGFLERGLMFGRKPLVDACLGYIDDHANAVLNSDGFRQLSATTLQTILDGDTLKHEERNIFESVLLWAEEECHRKELDPSVSNLIKIMSGVKKSIRFPLLDAEYLAKCIMKNDGLLKKNEEIQILYQKLGTHRKRRGSYCPDLFAATPRKRRVVSLQAVVTSNDLFLKASVLSSKVEITSGADGQLTHLILSDKMNSTVKKRTQPFETGTFVERATTDAMYYYAKQNLTPCVSNEYFQIAGKVITEKEEKDFVFMISSGNNSVELNPTIQLRKGEPRIITVELQVDVNDGRTAREGDKDKEGDANRDPGTNQASASSQHQSELISPVSDEPLGIQSDDVSVVYQDELAALVGFTIVLDSHI